MPQLSRQARDRRQQLLHARSRYIDSEPIARPPPAPALLMRDVMTLNFTAEERNVVAQVCGDAGLTLKELSRTAADGLAAATEYVWVDSCGA